MGLGGVAIVILPSIMCLKLTFSDGLGGGYKNYLIETKIATISPKRLCSKWYCRNI